MIPNLKLKSDDGDLFENLEKYRRITGKLDYLTIMRANITFPINVVI